MAKATIAVAVLALALLLTGPVSAAQANRKLAQAVASGTGVGTATGQIAKSGSLNEALTYSNPYVSVGAAGGASYGVSVNNQGQPSISTAVGQGVTVSGFGQSNSEATANANNNGISGTSAGEAINVGSANGKVASDAAAAALARGP